MCVCVDSFSSQLEWCDLTNTGVDGSISVFKNATKNLVKAKVGGTKCYQGLPPELQQHSKLPTMNSF